MPIASPVALVANDPSWFPHRYDPDHDAFHLLRIDRELHRRTTFLDDEHLPADLPKLVIRRAELIEAAPAPAPLHFIFHSAYCCSTLLARAFDLPGISMGLKEPRVLQDLVGWRRRGGPPAKIGEVLAHSLRLLARPMSPGEAIVVKPSNIVNGLAGAMLTLLPDARAVLLHASLGAFVASIARKEMWGRLWARELFVGFMKEGEAARLGFDPEALMRQTDLQIAAAGWLIQQAMFADLAARHPGRTTPLQSATLLARPAETIRLLARAWHLPVNGQGAARIAGGQAFSRHSKTGATFGIAERASDQEDATYTHREEIEKVVGWGEAVARARGIGLDLPAPLFQ